MSAALVDLAATTGLAVWLDRSSGELQFGEGVTSDPGGVRTRSELADVTRSLAAGAGSEVAYRLYRNVRGKQGDRVLTAAGLRYDLTVTLPGCFGGEYAKTAGHYHPPGPDGVPFPEVYEVVHGRAVFVLQRVADVSAAAPRVLDAWVQVCEAGERILIPPACGHVTVNVGSGPLVVADLISVRCGHLYASFKALRGAAYHVLCAPEAGDVRLEANPAYADLPQAVLARGSRWTPFLPDDGPVYTHLCRAPADFAFLDRPAACAAQLLSLWSSA